MDDEVGIIWVSILCKKEVNDVNFAKVTLQTSVLEEMTSFYQNVLNMPLRECTQHSFTVVVGRTLLTFEQSSKKPFYHFALGIAESVFNEYAGVIKQHATILPSKDGEEIMRSVTWKGKQLYFEDPDQNILEILAFPTHPAATWLCVQEIGMPVLEVPAFAERLSMIENEFSPESASFRFYGDQEGVLVLVKERRPWYPTDRRASLHPIDVELASATGRVIEFVKEQLPYRIVF